MLQVEEILLCSNLHLNLVCYPEMHTSRLSGVGPMQHKQQLSLIPRTFSQQAADACYASQLPPDKLVVSSTTAVAQLHLLNTRQCWYAECIRASASI